MPEPRFHTDVRVGDTRVARVTLFGVPIQVWVVLILLIALTSWGVRACTGPSSPISSALNLHNEEARKAFAGIGKDDFSRTYALAEINILLTEGEYACAAEGLWAVGHVPMWKQLALYEQDQKLNWESQRKLGIREPKPQINRRSLLKELRAERAMCDALCNYCRNIANDPRNTNQRQRLANQLKLYGFNKAASAEMERVMGMVP